MGKALMDNGYDVNDVPFDSGGDGAENNRDITNKAKADMARDDFEGPVVMGHGEGTRIEDMGQLVTKRNIGPSGDTTLSMRKLYAGVTPAYSYQGNCYSSKDSISSHNPRSQTRDPDTRAMGAEAASFIRGLK